MMSYAGIELPVVTRELAAWVQANIPPAEAPQFDAFANINALNCLPIPDTYRPPPVRTGVLVWPTGASRWATFYTVLTGEQLAALRLALIPDPDVTPTGYPEASLVIEDDRGSITVPMTMLPPRPLSGWSPEPTPSLLAPSWDPETCGDLCSDVCVDPEDPYCTDCMDGCPGNPYGEDEIFGEENSLYLVTLVDARYFWWFRRYTASYSAQWNLLFKGLLETAGYPTILPVDLEYLNTGYPSPGTRWSVKNQPLPILLDAACEAIGRKFVYNFDGSYDLPTWQQARYKSQILYALQYDTAWPDGESGLDLSAEGFGRVAGGVVPTTDIRRTVPEEVAVVEGDDGSGGEYVVTLASLNMTQYLDPYSNGSGYQEILGRADETVVIRLDDGISAEIADRAATDFYGWRLSNVDLTLAGVAAWEPCAWQDHVTWDHSGPRVVTRVVPWPNTPWVTKGLCGSPAGGGDGGFWAALTDKTFSSCPEYTFVEVKEDGVPTTWEAVPDGLSGTAYEVNCVILPTAALGGGTVVVRMHTDANGDYYFEMGPRWEIVAPTGPAVDGVAPGELYGWNPATQQLEPVETIKIVNAGFL